MREFPTKVVRGVTLRADPPRESAFQVVQLDAEMHEYPGMTPLAQRERLHRHMGNELGSLDIAAQCLADFPGTRDRKSTRLNSSHSQISYAVFCLKKKQRQQIRGPTQHSATSHHLRSLHPAKAVCTRISSQSILTHIARFWVQHLRANGSLVTTEH